MKLPFVMKLFPPLVVMAALCAVPCAAQKIDGRFKCELSGTGYEGGAGAGTLDNHGMHLEIDTDAKTIVLNGLKGYLVPEAQNQFTINWRWDVVQPTRLTLLVVGPHLVANLVNEDSRRLLEFSCR